MRNLSLAELEGLDPSYFKRSGQQQQDGTHSTIKLSKFSLDRGNESSVEKQLTKMKIDETLQKALSIGSANKSDKGFMEDSVKKYPKILREQQDLYRERSKRKMDVETPIGYGSLLKTPMPADCCSRTSSHTRRDRSHEMKHIEPLVDRLDVCDCPNHSRRSLSSCRLSKRKSQPLQDVVEKEDDEESQMYSDIKSSFKSPTR